MSGQFPAPDDSCNLGGLAHCKAHISSSVVTTVGLYEVVPGLGQARLSELEKMQVQEFFNSFIGKKSSETIRLMHGTLRAAFNEAVEWKIMEANPAIGIPLPKKKPVLLTFPQIKAMIETLPEPTRTIVVMIVFGSRRVGESLALRWEDILVERIIIDERLYDDEPRRTEDAQRQPRGATRSHGVIKEALATIWKDSKFQKPRDFIFATRNGTPTERRNVLRHVKAAAKKLGLPKEIDFRT